MIVIIALSEKFKSVGLQEVLQMSFISSELFFKLQLWLSSDLHEYHCKYKHADNLSSKDDAWAQKDQTEFWESFNWKAVFEGSSFSTTCL